MSKEDWLPRLDGNYSTWKAPFNSKVNKYCSTTNSFINGVSLFGSTASERLFKSFVSNEGIAKLTRYIQEGTFFHYLSSNPLLIVFFVLAVVVCLLQIILAFSLIRKFRTKLTAIVSLCRNQQNPLPKKVNNTSLYTPVFTVGFLSLISLIAIAIAIIVYGVYGALSLKSISCDTWQTFQGHYFGSQNLIASPIVPTSHWHGVQKEYDLMAELRDLVNPTPNNGSVCKICADVQNQFSGENGLINLLNTNRDRINQLIQKYLLLNLIFSTTIPQFNAQALSVDKFMDIADNGNAPKYFYSNAMNFILTTYLNEVTASTEKGIKLLQQGLDERLSTVSPMLRDSYEAANASLWSLADVNYVVANTVKKWTSLSMLFMFGNILIAVALFIALCSFVFPIIGIIMTIASLKYKKSNSLFSKRQCRLTASAYVGLILLSGISLILTVIFIFIARVGSDSCGVVDNVLYKNGEWKVLPQSLWNETITQRTDMTTVFDTCVKETGNGDIASSLGLRMLLVKLDQDLASSAKDATNRLEETLNLKFKKRQAEQIAHLVEVLPSSLVHDPATVTFPQDHDSRKWYITRGYYYTRPKAGGIEEPVTCLTNVFDVRTFDLTTIGMNFIMVCNEFLATTIAPADSTLNYINNLILEVSKTQPSMTITGICPKYLGQSNDCPLQSKDILIIIGGLDSDKKPVDNPFANKDIQTVITELKKSSDGGDLGVFVGGIISFWLFDTIFMSPLGTTNIDYSDAIPMIQALPTIFNASDYDQYEDTDIPPMLLLPKLLTMPDCEDPVKCTYDIPYEYFLQTANSTATEIREIYNTTVSSIEHFLKDVLIQEFREPLEKSIKSLSDFNCQFIGTSVYEGVRTGACRILLPSFISVGVLFFFVWLFSLASSWTIWRIYDYYENLWCMGEFDDSRQNSCKSNMDSMLQTTETPESTFAVSSRNMDNFHNSKNNHSKDTIDHDLLSNQGGTSTLSRSDVSSKDDDDEEASIEEQEKEKEGSETGHKKDHNEHSVHFQKAAEGKTTTSS